MARRAYPRGFRGSSERRLDCSDVPFLGGLPDQAGLRLDHIDTRIVKCPFAESFAQHGDPARFAEEYIPTIRTWNESIYFSGLSDQRPLEERRQIIKDYYGTYRDMVRESPDGHGMDYVHAYMVISKVA